MRVAGAGMTSGSVLRWSLILLLALAFKEFYSLAETSQLQWLLWPLATLLNAIGGFRFAPTASGEWLDTDAGLVIVKACAGGNFLIASWLGYLWRWRERPFNASLALRAFGADWLTTLAANAARILLIAHGQDDLARVTGLSDADSHRMIGIGVYFGALWLQLVGTRTALAAPALYLGVAVLLPWLNAMFSGRDDGISVSHAAWTAVIPLTVVLGYGLWRFGQHFTHVQKRRQSIGRKRFFGSAL
jgi:exosortase K